jgi:two-component system sensor kinase FixL
LLLGLSKFRDTGIEVERRIDPAATRVRGDAVHIQQVLVNLIRNSCEAMADSPTKKLRITVALDDENADMVRVSVADTGAGLAPDILPELFTAFTSTKHAGLGVGLSISRSIVRAHGGRIWAANRARGGTAFSFTLPLCEAQP